MLARRSPRHSLGLRPLLLVFALVALLGRSATCRAGLIIQLATDVTATAGSSGFFDVILSNDSPAGSTPFEVASDSFRLSLTGIAGVTFTNATIETSGTFAGRNYSYIYDTSITTGGYPLSYDPFPTTSFSVLDSEFGSAGSRTVAAGDVYGLARVFYSVAANAATGSGQLVFGNQPGDNSLSDNAFPVPNELPFTTQNGTFTINAGGTVPEPSSLVLGLIGLGMGTLARFGRLTPARRLWA